MSFTKPTYEQIASNELIEQIQERSNEWVSVVSKNLELSENLTPDERETLTDFLSFSISTESCEVSFVATPYTRVSEKDVETMAQDLRAQQDEFTWLAFGPETERYSFNGIVNADLKKDKNDPAIVFEDWYNTSLKNYRDAKAFKDIPDNAAIKSFLKEAHASGTLLINGQDELALPTDDIIYRLRAYELIRTYQDEPSSLSTQRLKSYFKQAYYRYQEDKLDEALSLTYTSRAYAKIPEQLKTNSFSYEFAQARKPFDIGIEISDPKLLPAGVKNLDHHSRGDTDETPSACEQALELSAADLKNVKTLGVLRMDKDTLAAAAILELKTQDEVEINAELAKLIGLVDRYGLKVYKDNPDYEKYRGAVTLMDLISVDRSISINQKIALAKAIVSGSYPFEYANDALALRNERYEAAKRESRVQVVVPGKLVFVESSHRFAMDIGYEHGSTVIAYNPRTPHLKIIEYQGKKYSIPLRETYRKYTIAKKDTTVPFNLDALLARLNELEEVEFKRTHGLLDRPGGLTVISNRKEYDNKWGGRGTIIGSPQEESSNIAPEVVIEEAQREAEKV